MIVDIHTHYFDPKTNFGLQLKSDLAKSRIIPESWGDIGQRHLETTLKADVAVVFGLRASATGWNIPNESVAAHVSKAPDRLLFFTSIDPLEINFMELLKYDHMELGAVGVKLAPLYQNVHPCDSRYYEIYKYCSKNGLPILFHTGTSFVSGTYLDFSRPAHFDKIAVDFPELYMVLAHLGHPWEGETIATIRRNPNVYADLSALYYRPWQFYNSMRLLIEYGVEHKVLFGSDFPFTTTESSIKGIRNVNAVIANSGLPSIPREAVEKIINRDSLELLGLSIPKDRNNNK